MDKCYILQAEFVNIDGEISSTNTVAVFEKEEDAKHMKDKCMRYYRDVNSTGYKESFPLWTKMVETYKSIWPNNEMRFIVSPVQFIKGE